MGNQPCVVIGESLRLHCFDRIPEELLEVPATELWRYLRGPSLFRLPGRQAEPLFVSVLLHGNEDTGWRAIQTILRQHRTRTLHRPLSATLKPRRPTCGPFPSRKTTIGHG